MPYFNRDDCQVYWGSHGCSLTRGHEGACICSCCDNTVQNCDDTGCVAHPPYYGPDTKFYGADAAERGLPTLSD